MFFLLTVRAHVSEVQIFEDFLNILLPDIKKRKEYYFSVEKDGSPDRHLHVVLRDPSPDRKNFIKKFKKKIYEEFKNSLKDTSTLWDPEFKSKFFQILPIKLEEVKLKIGYVFKENDLTRYAVHFPEWEEFPDAADVTPASQAQSAEAFIAECVKLHYAKERIDARTKHEDDIVLVTPKNFHAKVNEFIKTDEESDYNDHLIQYRMVKSGYSFLNMSDNQTCKGFKELRIMKGKEFDRDMEDVRRKLFEDSETNEQQILQDLKTLLFDPPDFGETHAKLKHKYYWLEDRNFF